MLPESPEKSSAIFSNTDLSRIEAETFIEQLEFHRELGSTNDLALEHASQKDLQLPLLVLAETQTAGRGRRANRWWSADGALTFSLLLDCQSARLPASRWSQVSMTAGLAVCEALEKLLPNQDVRLKWPNDVYVAHRKVSGILVEAAHQPYQRLVLGVGVNVNNSRANAPEELTSTAISVSDVAGKQFALTQILIAILRKLDERLEWIGKCDEVLRERWRARCMLTNRQVQVDDSKGLCRGIDDEGALVLQTDDGLQRCFAGTVTLFDQ